MCLSPAAWSNEGRMRESLNLQAFPIDVSLESCLKTSVSGAVILSEKAGSECSVLTGGHTPVWVGVRE